jgi:hypothetical protein
MGPISGPLLFAWNYLSFKYGVGHLRIVMQASSRYLLQDTR